MSIYVDVRAQEAAIAVGSNGYVVGINPQSKVKIKPGDPGEVNDGAMKTLYHIAPKYIERRQTDWK